MGKFKISGNIVFLLLAIAFINSEKCFANADMDLKVNDQNKIKINMTAPVKLMNGQVFKSKDELFKEYLQEQKKMDVDDIKILWEATVDKNPIIKFALRKLAAPASQRKVHSSIMAKSVSTLINGAAILPSMFGCDPITSTATSAGGSIAGRIIESKQMPKELPLTDTELIHLARLIEDLQDKVIKNYYEYKSGLESLKTARAEVFNQNNAYSKAIKANDSIAILTTKVLYDNAMKDEMLSKQNAKIHRLELARLAGDETFTKLKLGKIMDMDSSSSTPAVIESNNNSKLIDKVNYGDESITELSAEIGAELKDEQSQMLSDLSILWNSAVGRSETIRFAILKLSNPDGKIEKTSSVKRILEPLTSAATLVGMGTGNPMAVTSSMFGGEFLNSLLSSDSSELNSRLTKVTDADLVLLAQETDDLQQKLINLYFNYTNSLTELNFVNKTLNERKKYIGNPSNNNSAIQAVATVFYQQGLTDKHEAQQKALAARVALEQFVGNEALIAVDKNVKQRLSMQ